MRFLKKLTLITFVMLIAGACWAAIYAYDKGFTKKWRRLVNKEFEKYGIEASIGKLTLDPFQGLVARDVMFFEDASRRSLLAAVSRITLDIDFIRLLEEEFFLNSIDIKDADLSLPIDPNNPDSTRLEIQDFNARVFLPGNRIEISQAHGTLQGIEVAIRGSLFRSEEPGIESTSIVQPLDDETRLEIIRDRRHLVYRISKAMEQFDFPANNPPRVDIDVTGDLDDLRNLRGRVRFTAGPLGHGDYSCNKIDALLELAHGRASLKELHIVDDSGELVAQGEYKLGDDHIQLAVHSSLDIHGLLGSVFPDLALGEIVLYDAPRIHFDGSFLLDEFPITGSRLPVDCIGSIQCGTFASRGVIFDGLNADFSINREKIFFRNVVISHRDGSVIASGLYDSEGLRYDAVIKVDPAVFVPFSRSEGARKFLKRIKFNENSAVYLKLHGTGPSFDMKSWQSSGELDVRNFEYNGVPINHVRADLDYDGRQQHYRNVSIKTDAGTVTADEVSYHLDTHVSKITGASGTIYPARLTRCFHQGVAKHLEKYRFKSAPHVTVHGTLDPKGKRATDFHVKFVAVKGVDYDFLGKTLSFDTGTATLHFKGADLADAKIEGGLFGGKFATEFSIDDLPGSKDYAARVEVSSLSFQEIASRYGYHSDTRGELTGNFDFTGKGGDRKTINGKGGGSIVNGDVFAIPVLGPLSKILSGVVADKTAGHSIAREASANFVMKDGILSTDDFEALATGFRLRGAGTIDTTRDEIDFDVRMNARGAPGLLLLPVSKLLEYTCEGSLHDPVWRPKIIPAGPRPILQPKRKGGLETKTGSRN